MARKMPCMATDLSNKAYIAGYDMGSATMGCKIASQCHLESFKRALERSISVIFQLGNFSIGDN